jgi:hypothetical protein
MNRRNVLTFLSLMILPVACTIDYTPAQTGARMRAQTGRGPEVNTCFCDAGDGAVAPPAIPVGAEGDAEGYSCEEQCMIWDPTPKPLPTVPPDDPGVNIAEK